MSVPWPKHGQRQHSTWEIEVGTFWRHHHPIILWVFTYSDTKKKLQRYLPHYWGFWNIILPLGIGSEAHCRRWTHIFMTWIIRYSSSANQYWCYEKRPCSCKVPHIIRVCVHIYASNCWCWSTHTYIFIYVHEMTISRWTSTHSKVGQRRRRRRRQTPPPDSRPAHKLSEMPTAHSIFLREPQQVAVACLVSANLSSRYTISKLTNLNGGGCPTLIALTCGRIKSTPASKQITYESWTNENSISTWII